MDSSASSVPVGKDLLADPALKIRHLPAEAQAAFQLFQVGRDPASLDPLIFSILEQYIPRKPTSPLARQAGNLRLMEDLGFDSLAITEVVFFTEELLEISIANEEIIQVRTLDDLRGFIRAKVAARGTA
jgi:hypothetical protein